MGIFREYLNSLISIIPEKQPNINDLYNIELEESLDTHSEISKIESKDGFKFYYFEINDKRFRVILEKVDDETGINFEQYLKGVYTTAGLSNNLDTKETLLLFGTLFYIIKTYAIAKHYSVFTDNPKKFRVYLKILTAKGAKNVRYKFIYNDRIVHIEFETEDTYNFMDKTIKKFKYKTNLI